MNKPTRSSSLLTDQLCGKERVHEIKEVNTFKVKFSLGQDGKLPNESFSDVNSLQVNVQGKTTP